MLLKTLATYNPFPFPVSEQLKPWCLEITIIFLLFLIFVYPLMFYLGRKARTNDKIRDYFTMTMGLILISTEIYKQILFAYHYNFEGDYHWSLFPFQLCSIPMYTSAIMPLARNEKLRKSLFSFMALYGMLGGLSVTLYQTSVLTREDYSLDYQSIIWHFALIALGIYSATYLNIGSLSFKKSLKLYQYGTFAFLGFLILAEIINLLIVLNHGYNEFTAGGNMFYISMFMFNLDIPVLSTITSTCGWYVGFIGYTFVLMLGAFVIFSAYYGLNKLTLKILANQKLQKLILKFTKKENK